MGIRDAVKWRDKMRMEEDGERRREKEREDRIKK